MEPLLADGATEGRLEVSHNFAMATAPFGETKQWNRDGATHKATFRVACETCNNTWMSVIETTAKAFLTPLIKGEVTFVSPQIAQHLARWIALKVMVIDGASVAGERATPTFEQCTREAFRATREVLPGLRTWIGAAGGPKWRASFTRHSGTMFLSPTPLLADELIPTGPRRNIQSVTLGIGNLLLHVVSTSDAELYSAIKWEDPPTCVPIWPPTSETILWPPNSALTDWSIDADVASALGQLFRELPRRAHQS